MAGYRDLREGFDAYLARKISARPTQTGPSGIIDLGAQGDVRWNEGGEGGPTYSVKGLPTYIEEALEAGLSTTGKANTVSTSPPPGTSEGYPEGAYWVQVVAVDDPSVLGVWQEESGAWVAQPYDGGFIAPTIDAGLINVAVLGAKLILARVVRTPTNPVTGRYSVFDSEGFRVITEEGPEGSEEALINLGPSGEQLLQLGSGEDLVSINSSGGISSRTISARELYLDGKRLQVHNGPSGIVSRARMSGGRSRRLNGRDIVLGLEGTLRPGRVYKLECSSVVVDNENSGCDPFLQLHYTLDGTAPQSNWSGSASKESRRGAYSGFRSHHGMHHWIDLTDRDPNGSTRRLRAALSLANYASNGWVQAVATTDNIWLVCEDWGTEFPDRGTPFFYDGGSSGAPPPVYYKRKFNATAMATYVRGGARDQSGGFVQGQYSSWNRETLIVFENMTAELNGATIHRITCRSFFDSWYDNAGGTASWNWHAETGIPGSSPAKTFMVDTAGWPRGAAREININPDEFSQWQNGNRRGFMFSTPVTALSHYGKLSPHLNQHWIEVEYSK